MHTLEGLAINRLSTMHGLKEYEKDHGHQMNDPDEQA